MAGGHAPASFALHLNYPNPFNPATVIRYALGARTHFRLQVVNVLGEVVSTLVEAEQEPG